MEGGDPAQRENKLLLRLRQLQPWPVTSEELASYPPSFTESVDAIYYLQRTYQLKLPISSGRKGVWIAYTLLYLLDQPVRRDIDLLLASNYLDREAFIFAWPTLHNAYTTRPSLLRSLLYTRSDVKDIQDPLNSSPYVISTGARVPSTNHLITNRSSVMTRGLTRFLRPALTAMYIDLTSLPLDLFKVQGKWRQDLQYLDLSHNQLSSLPAELSQLPLLSLRLRYNQLKVVPAFLLEHSTLQELYLDGNPLQSFEEPKSFTLHSLSLKDCGLSEVPPFLGDNSKLLRLDLRMNRLRSFRLVRSIQWLNLSHNRLQRVELLNNIWSYLNLSYNPLRAVQFLQEQAPIPQLLDLRCTLIIEFTLQNGRVLLNSKDESPVPEINVIHGSQDIFEKSRRSILQTLGVDDETLAKYLAPSTT